MSKNEVFNLCPDPDASGAYRFAGIDMRRAFREHSRNIQGTFREHSGAFREHSGAFREHSGTSKEYSGYIQVHSGNIQVHPRNIQGTFTEHWSCTFSTIQGGH